MHPETKPFIHKTEAPYNPPAKIMLRPGRLRHRFHISGRQWRKMNRNARQSKRLELRTPTPQQFFTALWHEIAVAKPARR